MVERVSSKDRKSLIEIANLPKLPPIKEIDGQQTVLDNYTEASHPSVQKLDLNSPGRRPNNIYEKVGKVSPSSKAGLSPPMACKLAKGT